MERDGSWCCADCLIIHRPNVAEMVVDALMEGQSIPLVWKTLEELL
jgi:Zn-finger protein